MAPAEEAIWSQTVLHPRRHGNEVLALEVKPSVNYLCEKDCISISADCDRSETHIMAHCGGDIVAIEYEVGLGWRGRG